MIAIDGAKKKAKKPKQPYTAPDSARSKSFAKLLFALAEGEVEGTENGNLSAKAIFLDGVPIQNADGSFNHGNVKWEFRNGSNDQDYIPAMPMVESDISVGQVIKTTTPWTRSITNTDVDILRIRLSWPQLVNNKSNGDRVGVTMQYAIDLAVGTGSFEQVQSHTLSDKSTSKYERTHAVELPRSADGWRIRVRRITADQTTDMIQDAMAIEAYTEVIDAKLTYPNTSLLYLEFDAEQFAQIPKVTVQMKGWIVRVPENYNPKLRVYTGVWDGRWKWAYTNNPVWATLGVIVSDRAGAGERITLDQVDKWGLYEIARWCDVAVSNGNGGTEPRHALNVYIQSQQDAWRILGDLTSNFNGVSYWNGQQLEIQGDLLRDADFVYTRANVVDGKFNYSAISRKQKYTQALVKYGDPANNYETDTVAVNDIKLTRRFGVVQSSVADFGGTSRSQAQRKGKQALLTNYLDRIVDFKAGLDGYLPKLGRIIGVADNLLAGAEIGGRVKAARSNKITLDREPRAKAGDRLTINLPSGVSETRNVLSVSGNVVTVDALYSEPINQHAVWSIDAGDLAVQLYRVTNIKQDSDSQFSISAVQYDPKKYAAIDSGAALDDRPITRTPANEQSPPTNLTITQYDYVEQGMAVTNVSLGWDIVAGAVRYELQWRKDRMQWINVAPQSSTTFDIEGVYSGLYEFRVRAVNAIDIASTWVPSTALQVNGKAGAPPKLAYLNAKSLVFGIELKWGFPAEGAKDTSRTELQYRVLGGAEMILGDFSYPTDTYTMLGLKAGVEFQFRGRLHDRTGNIGAWSEWVLGSSSADAGDILDYLTGQITESELGQSLLGPIRQIPVISGRVDSIDVSIEGIDTSIGNINTSVSGIDQRVTDAVSQMEIDKQLILDDLSDLYAQVAQITGSEAYDPLVPYLKGAIVKFDEGLYKAIQDAPIGILPTNAAYWEKVGDYASLTDMLQDLAVRVNTAEVRVAEINGVVTPMATQLNALRATTRRGDDWSDISDAIRGWETIADFTEEVTVRSNQYEALSQRITNLRVSIDEDISAQITLLEQTIATETQALSLRIDIQEAGLGDANSSIANTNAALATLESATASSLQQLETNFGEMNATFSDAIVALTDADTALSTRITAAQAKANVNEADIRTEESVRADETSALSTRVSTAQAKADKATADLRLEETTRADETGALSLRVDTVSAATVTAQETADTARTEAENKAAAAQAAAKLYTDAEAEAARLAAIATASGDATDKANAAKAAAEAAAALDATTKADAARDAAIAVANTAQDTADNALAATVINNAEIGRVDQALIDAESALSSRIDTVSADTTVVSGAVAEAQAKADKAEADAADAKQYAELQAEAARLAAIAAASGDATDKANAAQAEAERLAALDATTKANAAADLANAAQQAADAANQGVIDNSAAIAVETTARTDANEALSNRLSSFRAASRGLDDLSALNDVIANWQTNAAVSEEITVRADQYGSLTSQVTTAQSTANGAKALAETNTSTIANVDGTLKAQTTIKVQTEGTGGRKVITGIGLVADGETGESSVLIQANRFGLISSLNGTQTTPFVVENGQTFINEAFIKDATLVNAIVRNRLVSAAKDPQGRPLVDINFVTGEFILRAFVAGQGRTETTNKGTRVYDAAGNIRVKLGDLT